MEKQLILIDENNNIIGYGNKQDVHKLGQLHRAFSIFLYDKASDSFLMQKRASDKYHSGGKWSNSCCSHPYRDELIVDSFKRCLKDELLIEMNDGMKMDEAGTFLYYSNYGEMKEHELDLVVIMSFDRKLLIAFNKEEVSEVKWMKIDEIEELIKKEPKCFSSWFEKAYQLAKKKYEELYK